MRRTQAHALVEALEKAGITHVFGIPGTHNIELYDALADSGISTVLLTDEQSAGFMADGYARASGRLAAICLVPGAGLTHALSGIAEAHLDQVPLLVIACGVRRDLRRRFQLHEIDQLAVVKPVCKWAGTVSDWNNLPKLIESAARLAKQTPAGPVVIEIPGEGLALENPPSRGHPQQLPQEPLRRARDELNWGILRAMLGGSRQIGLYFGNIGGEKNDQERLVKLADRLNAWVWSTLSGKGLYPEDDDRFLWNVAGSASPPAIQELESRVDLWIAFGGKFGEVPTASYGFAPKGRVIHINLAQEPCLENLTANLSMDCDAWEVIDQLLMENITSGNPESRLQARHAREQVLAGRPVSGEEGKIPPAHFFGTLQQVLPSDTAYAVDSGNGMFLAMENLRLKDPRCFLAPTDFSCMGYSVPAAVGARFADPHRIVVALPGDGAFLMTGLELLTGIREGLAPLVIVLRDGKLSQIAQFQRQSLGREAAVKLPEYDLSLLAAAIGAHHERLSDPQSLARQLKDLADHHRAGKPVLAEVMIDYTVPTFFTQGVAKNVFNRLPLQDRIAVEKRLRARV